MTIRLPHRGWLLDLDGTVYVGERLVPGADTTIAALRAAGRRVAFLSNKPLETREAYAGKLTRLGVPARPDDVVNSSLVLARHLRRLDPGAPVFVIGEPPLRAELAAHGVRARVDGRGESVGRKIRDAELAKVPYMLVVGDRELEAGNAAVRSHADGDLGTMDAAAFAERLGGRS